MKTERKTNLDALRLFSMLMIVLQHGLYHSGLLNRGVLEPFSATWYIAWFLYALARCSVDVFFILSGYLLCEKEFRSARLVSLMLKTAFWCTAGYLAATLIGHGSIDGKILIRNLFPLTTKQYWFMTVYMGLLMVAPLLNRGMGALNKRLTIAITVFLVIASCYIPNIQYVHDVMSSGGETSLLWAIALYLVGSCIRKYAIVDRWELCWVSIYIMFAVITLWLRVRMERLNPENTYAQYAYFQNHTWFMFIEAYAVVRFFLALPGKGPKIWSILGSGTIAVYLLHDQPQLRKLLWNATGVLGKANSSWMPLYLIGVCVVILVCGCLLEWPRALLFQRLERAKIWEKLDHIILK